MLTGIIAGSYPALYLSSFNPVSVLKGTFLPGKKATLPRRILVVAQFVISILLISSTIIVYRQIQYTKEREAGYSRDGLLTADLNTMDAMSHEEAVRTELLRSGIVADAGASSAFFVATLYRYVFPSFR